MKNLNHAASTPGVVAVISEGTDQHSLPMMACTVDVQNLQLNTQVVAHSKIFQGIERRHDLGDVVLNREWGLWGRPEGETGEAGAHNATEGIARKTRPSASLHTKKKNDQGSFQLNPASSKSELDNRNHQFQIDCQSLEGIISRPALCKPKKKGKDRRDIRDG